MVSCADDFPYSVGSIPEGEGTLSATVTFTPMKESSLGATRTAGDAIKDINSLCVLVYSPKGDLLKSYYGVSNINTDVSCDFKYEDKTYDVNADDHLDGNEAHPAETTTANAKFTLKGLPYGIYKIYAVANMGDLSTKETTFTDSEGKNIAIKNAIKTESGLKNIKLTWDPDEITNNAQMFGYFTPDNDMESKGFDAPAITFKSDTKIHAWLKRAASKVTVAFDPSGLNQGVVIYVRSVTIRDIPKYCLLGAENTPTNTNDLYNYLGSYTDPDFEKNPTEAEPNSRLEYNSKGVITDPEEVMGTEKTSGLRLDNSKRSAIPEGAHNADKPSLFFYENNQNAWLKQQNPNYNKDNKYNKEPQKTGDDAIGTTIHDPSNDKDFKDRVPFGTYVEVEAYYISSNPANPGEGTIKYRFMLGKDISFDYDAQRNYHFKLTLGFNGWANDPDWHIDYIITNPDIEVPDVFRVSYLYQQKSELPIKIIGEIEWLTVLITENNWAPYDPNPATNQEIEQGGKKYLVPKQEINEGEDETYNFKWNQEAFENNAYRNPVPTSTTNYPDSLTAGQQRPQFGFLALHLPSRNTTTITTEYSEGANKELIDYWKENLEGERRFMGIQDVESDNYNDLRIQTLPHESTYHDKNKNNEDDYYYVNPVLNDNNDPIPGQRILMLPVWTRTKTLIQTSGFSGNNPYEAFERKAVVHIVGQFKTKDENGDPIRIQKDVEVYQVKRITNPKGVWRAHDRTEAFNVTLLEPINSNAESDFQPFTSQGEWTAFIDEETNKGAGFSIRPNGQTNGYMKNGVIHGNTGSEIHFAIDFVNAVDENESQCAVVKVLYHGNQCMHKILVRKGYNAPLRMGEKSYPTSDGGSVKGKRWSSFSLYQATKTGGTAGVDETFAAYLTKNPLMLGSMFRRGRLEQGIFVWNNMQPGLGPLVPPAGKALVLGMPKEGVKIKPGLIGKPWEDQWETKAFENIFRVDDRNSNKNLGIYYALDDDGNYTTDERGNPIKYRVPTYEEFQDLTDNSEFGFGVFYGSAATEPQIESKKAYGLIDPYNQGLFEDPNGMRAVVAYDKKTGNQILFPIGRYGIGVRRIYNIPNNSYWGVLHYSDVYETLTIERSPKNLYRPIPYNLPIVSGCIYWIDQWVAAGTYGNTEPSLGWDMNYFNFDFNAYTANNWADACPIKFVIDE